MDGGILFGTCGTLPRLASQAELKNLFDLIQLFEFKRYFLNMPKVLELSTMFALFTDKKGTKK
jgi:hypothetical protein